MSQKIELVHNYLLLKHKSYILVISAYFLGVGKTEKSVRYFEQYGATEHHPCILRNARH
jgi:hypothetical protein